jgi:hypothetical protein
MDKDIFDRFFSLACALSPENLNEDGEISMARAARKYNRLMKEWRTLENHIGRSVSEHEIWAAADSYKTR